MSRIITTAIMERYGLLPTRQRLAAMVKNSKIETHKETVEAEKQVQNWAAQLRDVEINEEPYDSTGENATAESAMAAVRELLSHAGITGGPNNSQD
jgi:hypothetical protein